VNLETFAPTKKEERGAHTDRQGDRRIDEILSHPAIPRGAGVRIGPADGATAAAGEFMVTIAEVPAITDEVIDDRGARIRR
jgi:hypothetical protein